MALALNHFSIRTTDMDATRVFYEKVLGLTVGPRPPFPFFIKLCGGLAGLVFYFLFQNFIFFSVLRYGKFGRHGISSLRTVLDCKNYSLVPFK